MLSFPQAVHRRRIPPQKIPAAPPLVLVSAGYEPEVPSIDLLFDRDIDFSGIDVGAFTVADGEIAMCTWVGNGIVAVDDGGAWAGAAGMGLPWP